MFSLKLLDASAVLKNNSYDLLDNYPRFQVVVEPQLAPCSQRLHQAPAALDRVVSERAFQGSNLPLEHSERVWSGALRQRLQLLLPLVT